MTEKNEIFWSEIGPVFGEQGSPQEFQGVLSSFFYYFSFNFKDPRAILGSSHNVSKRVLRAFHDRSWASHFKFVSSN